MTLSILNRTPSMEEITQRNLHAQANGSRSRIDNALASLSTGLASSSTGLKTRAAQDDAAGISINEGYRNQDTGAIVNREDANSRLANSGIQEATGAATGGAEATGAATGGAEATGAATGGAEATGAAGSAATTADTGTGSLFNMTDAAKSLKLINAQGAPPPPLEGGTGNLVNTTDSQQAPPSGMSADQGQASNNVALGMDSEAKDLAKLKMKQQAAADAFSNLNVNAVPTGLLSLFR